jgi:membrane protease subunit HflC
VRIFADAVSRDVDFFTFYRSMQAYRTALGDENTSFVLSPNSEFFRFFDSPTLPPVEQASAPAQDAEDGVETRAAEQSSPGSTAAPTPATAID